jgi:hypothetical protein
VTPRKNPSPKPRKNPRAAASSSAPSSASANQQFASFIAKFDPAIARQIRACRAILRKRFPTAIEIVYDNYNFFVIGFCSTERSSDCIVSLAANSKGVGLSFYWGATLPDPHKLLQGSGSQNRFVRLPTPKTLADPKVSALIDAAVSQAKNPLPSTGRGVTIIKSISAKQRPRR